MHHHSFPRCQVQGPTDPVPFSHLGAQGSVPRKCAACAHLFEGECTRALEQVKGYLALDHGPCPIQGKTTPVHIDNRFLRSKVEVPEKCSTCRHLTLDFIRGFTCAHDEKVWGGFPRSLDWGGWSPEHPNIGLRSGRSVSSAVLSAVMKNEEAEAVKAFRQDFPDATIREARDAFAELRSKLRDV